jgi:hypothetical protein
MLGPRMYHDLIKIVLSLRFIMTRKIKLDNREIVMMVEEEWFKPIINRILQEVGQLGMVEYINKVLEDTRVTKDTIGVRVHQDRWIIITQRR